MLDSRIFGLWLPFLFHTLSLVVASSYFELGVYSDELQEFGYRAGAGEALLVYFALSLAVFYVVWRSLPAGIRTAPLELPSENFFLVVIFLALLFFLVPLAFYGPPILTGANRYSFNKLPMVSMFNIKLYLGILCFPLGLIVGRKSRGSLYAKLLFLGILFANILYGEKFSGPSVALLFFFSGFLVVINRKISVLKLGLAFVFILGLVVTVYHAQLLLQGARLEDVYDHFITRVARQGQLWWKSYSMSTEMRLFEHSRGSELLFEYDRLKYSDFEGGMRYMMSVVMPERVFIKHQGSLAGGYPTILLYVDGGRYFYFWAIGFAALYVIPVYFMFLVFFSNSWTSLLVPPMAYFYGVHLKIFQSGNLYLISNPKYIAMYSMIIFIGLAVLTSQVVKEKSRGRPS